MTEVLPGIGHDAAVAVSANGGASGIGIDAEIELLLGN